MPLTAAEIVEHPAFNTVKWQLKPTKKGKCPVAHGRGGPIEIAYEIHGDGPIHLIVGRSQNVVEGMRLPASAAIQLWQRLRDEASGSWVLAPSCGIGRDKPKISVTTRLPSIHALFSIIAVWGKVTNH